MPRGGCTRGGAAQARREPRRRRRPGRCRCADGVRGTTRLGDAARLRRSCSRHTRRGGRAVVGVQRAPVRGVRMGYSRRHRRPDRSGEIRVGDPRLHRCASHHHSAVGLGCDLVCDCVPSQRLRPHPARHDEPFHSDCTLQKDIRQRGLRCQLLSRDRHAMDFDSSLWKTSTDIDSGERTSDRINDMTIAMSESTASFDTDQLISGAVAALTAGRGLRREDVARGNRHRRCAAVPQARRPVIVEGPRGRGAGALLRSPITDLYDGLGGRVAFAPAAENPRRRLPIGGSQDVVRPEGFEPPVF